MSNKCVRCGVPIEAQYDTCPQCGVAHLMAIDSSSGSMTEANTVSVPVRRKRTLPNSCLLGILLFIPVFAIAVMLVHFHLKNQADLDERMSLKPASTTASSQPLDRTAMVEMMSNHLRKEAHGIVSSVSSVDGSVMIVHVTEEWRGLSAKRQKECMLAWLNCWQSLGGGTMVIEAVPNGADDE